MRRRLFVMTVFTLLALSVDSSSQTVTPRTSRDLRHEKAGVRHLPDVTANSSTSPLRGAIVDTALAHPYDALFLDVKVVPDLAGKTVSMVVDNRVRITQAGVTKIPFHLFGPSIDSVLVDGEKANYSRLDDIVSVTLPPTSVAGDTFTARFVYHDNLQTTDDQRGGMIYCESATIPYQLDDFVYTFGEPYGTRRWLACYDHPADKVLTRMEVVADSAYRVLSNGTLREDVLLGNGTRRTVWQSDHPLSTYLITLNISKYHEVDAGGAGSNSVPISYWLPGDASVQHDAMLIMNQTPNMIAFYEDLFGSYAFDKYAQCIAPLACGGMEHQTATAIGLDWLTGTNQYDYVVAHELAHHWWGDDVGPLTFRDAWLNEGFATYSDALWQARNGDPTLQYVMDAYRQYYFNDDAYRERVPVYDPPFNPSIDPMRRLFAWTIYGKGAWILHMLRGWMGDEVFFNALSTYRSLHTYGSATTAELEQDFEDVSGMDLSTFFNQWVYQAGYPVFACSGLDAAQKTDGSVSATFTLEQVQENAPLFSTPLLPVKFVGQGRDTLVYLPFNASPTQQLTATSLGFAPDSVTVDEYSAILCQVVRNSGVVAHPPSTPDEYRLARTWPNPFNGSMFLEFELPRAAPTTVAVFDLLGRRVFERQLGVLTLGRHRVQWNPKADLASGTYLLTIQADGKRHVRRITLLR